MKIKFIVSFVNQFVVASFYELFLKLYMNSEHTILLFFQLNGSIRPVPPPRDHLRMEKDGRMVNRAPAPQVPDRNPALQTHQIAQIVDATPEQLDSIKKYQVHYIYKASTLYTLFLCC